MGCVSSITSFLPKLLLVTCLYLSNSNQTKSQRVCVCVCVCVSVEAGRKERGTQLGKVTNGPNTAGVSSPIFQADEL